jgi:hypothetical protein
MAGLVPVRLGYSHAVMFVLSELGDGGALLWLKILAKGFPPLALE